MFRATVAFVLFALRLWKRLPASERRRLRAAAQRHGLTAARRHAVPLARRHGPRLASSLTRRSRT